MGCCSIASRTFAWLVNLALGALGTLTCLIAAVALGGEFGFRPSDMYVLTAGVFGGLLACGALQVLVALFGAFALLTGHKSLVKPYLVGIVFVLLSGIALVAASAVLVRHVTLETNFLNVFTPGSISKDADHDATLLLATASCDFDPASVKFRAPRWSLGTVPTTTGVRHRPKALNVLCEGVGHVVGTIANKQTMNRAFVELEVQTCAEANLANTQVGNMQSSAEVCVAAERVLQMFRNSLYGFLVAGCAVVGFCLVLAAGGLFAMRDREHRERVRAIVIGRAVPAPSPPLVHADDAQRRPLVP